jgi:hypothetical protein
MVELGPSSTIVNHIMQCTNGDNEIERIQFQSREKHHFHSLCRFGHPA